jgi:hypothetical protein
MMMVFHVMMYGIMVYNAVALIKPMTRIRQRHLPPHRHSLIHLCGFYGILCGIWFYEYAFCPWVLCDQSVRVCVWSCQLLRQLLHQRLSSPMTKF